MADSARMEASLTPGTLEFAFAIIPWPAIARKLRKFEASPLVVILLLLGYFA